MAVLFIMFELPFIDNDSTIFPELVYRWKNPERLKVDCFESEERYVIAAGDSRTIVIGLAADSGCGKSTFMRRLTSVFGGATEPPRGGNPDSNTLISDTTAVICLDDYHSLDRTGKKVAGVTALDPKANDFDLMYEQVKAIKDEKKRLLKMELRFRNRYIIMLMVFWILLSLSNLLRFSLSKACTQCRRHFQFDHPTIMFINLLKMLIFLKPLLKHYLQRAELIQDLKFETATTKIKVSPDGEFIIASGIYPPHVKVYELKGARLSLKFERHLVSEIVDFKLSRSWKQDQISKYAKK